jgi:prevent-host-death family protein
LALLAIGPASATTFTALDVFGDSTVDIQSRRQGRGDRPGRRWPGSSVTRVISWFKKRRQVREIAAFEAKNRFGQLFDWVANGEEVTIARRGKEVARLVPAKPGFNRDEARAAVRRIRKRAEQLKLGLFDCTEWKGFRDESRP